MHQLVKDGRSLKTMWGQLEGLSSYAHSAHMGRALLPFTRSDIDVIFGRCRGLVTRYPADTAEPVQVTDGRDDLDIFGVGELG